MSLSEQFIQWFIKKDKLTLNDKREKKIEESNVTIYEKCKIEKKWLLGATKNKN